MISSGNMKEQIHKVLQVNLENTGGAFSLMFQIQQCLRDIVVFDWFCMGEFTRNADYRVLKDIGCRIYEQKLRKNRLLGHMILPFRFFFFIKNHSYEVVHIHSDTAWKLLMYAYPAHLAGVDKIVVHAHSSEVNGDYKIIKRILHKICCYRLEKKATNTVACSYSAGEWMFLNRQEMLVLHNGVNVNQFCFNEQARIRVREELGIKSSEILIGTIGNFSYQKNPKRLLDIFGMLIQKKENVKLVFVGDGPERKDIEEYIKKKNINEKVIFYGKTEKVKDILSGMDIFILTSRFEGLPVSAVEAQVSGLPVLLSDTITPETKILSSTSFYMSDDEACNNLLTLMDCKGDRKKAAELLKKTEWDIECTSQKIMQLYNL